MEGEVEKVVSIPTQRYDIPSDWIGNQFVVIILEEFGVIWNHQWNAEMVINF